MRSATERDPLNVSWRGILASHLVHAGRIDDAIDESNQAMALDPHNLAPYTTLGEAYVMLERWQDAIDILGRAQSLWPGFALTTGLLAGALHRAGQASRAKELIEGLGNSPGPPTGVTLYHVISGDLDAAADWYTRSVELRDPFALVFANGPVAQALWRTPCWPRIAAMMRLPSEI